MIITRLRDLPINVEGSYLVHHLIPLHDLTVVWGKPKTGKTFWVLDLMMHVAAGLPYREKEVVKGAVVYCTLEGSWEFGARAHAASKALDLNGKDIPFYCSRDRMVFSKVGKADRLIKDIGSTLESAPVAVVIDTLNRSIDGSENKDEDMTNYTRCAEDIAHAFNCSIIVVHHGGVSGDKPRGHTSLTGTCAAQIEISRASKISIPGQPMMISAFVEFMKDGPEGEQIFSWLRPCTIGTNKKGQLIETCYIEEAPIPTFSDVKGIQSPQTKKAKAVLEEGITEAGIDRITITEWRNRCSALPLTNKPPASSAARMAFSRAMDALRKAGSIEIVDNIWVVLRRP